MQSNNSSNASTQANKQTPLTETSSNGQAPAKLEMNGKPMPTYLQKKGLLGRGGGAAGRGQGKSFASPTDNLMSPVTAKLTSSKQRHFAKGKPTTLFPSALGGKPATAEGSKENDSPFA